MPAATAIGDNLVIGSLNPVENKMISVPTHGAINEKLHQPGDHSDETDNADNVIHSEKGLEVGTEINAVPATPPYDDEDPGKESDSDDDVVIRTGALAAHHLLPMRDDKQSALTFRSIFLASGLSGFQAVMTQIYQVSESKMGLRCC